MIWTITNKNVLREISLFEDGLKAGSLTSLQHIRCPWKKTHIERVQKSIRRLMKQGFVWQDEKENYLITDKGKEWLKEQRRELLAA